MPLDYRLIAGLPAPQIGGTLAAIQDYGQQAEEERQIQRDRQAEQVLQQTLQRYADRPDEAVNELRRQGFAKQANDFEIHLGKVRKEKLSEYSTLLDMEYKRGQIDKMKADAAKAAVTADDTDIKPALEFVALADNQEDLDHGKALIKLKYGPKADAILATLPPTWTPELKTRISNMLLGPKGVAEIENQKADNTRAQEEAEQRRHAAAMAAADRLEDNARMAAQAAETARHNKAMEAYQAKQESRLASGGGAPKTLSPTAESNIINRLSNQWTAATKSSRELDRAVSLMDTGMTAARRGDLPQGAQAVLVTFQKILDPTSVVRESEYARSSAGLALIDRIQGAYERLAKGGAGVPLAELEKFARLAKEMADAQRATVNTTRERLGKTADRYNIPRELVTDQDATAAAPPTAGTAGAPAPASGGWVFDLKTGKLVKKGGG